MAPGIVLFVVLAAVVVSVCMGGTGGSYCKSHLRQIGISCLDYANDSNGMLPRSFTDLYPKYIDNLRILSCPQRESLWHDAQATGVVTPERTSYVYVSGLRADCDASCVLAFDRPGNHGENGSNVLFIDGRVDWMRHGELQGALAKTRAWAEKNGLTIRLLYEKAPGKGAGFCWRHRWSFAAGILAMLLGLLALWIVYQRRMGKEFPEWLFILIEALAIYLAILFVTSQIPNCLVIYSDDVGAYRLLTIPLLCLPILMWVCGRIITSRRRLLLAIVAACGMLACQHASYLLVSARHGLAGKPSSEFKGQDPLFILGLLNERDNFCAGDGWVLDISDEMPEGMELQYVHHSAPGSGTIQTQTLFSAKRSERGKLTAIDWNGYSYSGNHPVTTLRTEWIMPLHVTPFARRQFWIKRDHHNQTNRLFVVESDGKFRDLSAWWPVLAWGFALIPIAVCAMLRKQLLWRGIVSWVLVVSWCVAFSPWRSWGIGLGQPRPARTSSRE